MTAQDGRPELARVLMTVDAVGGVWRYGLDLALGLRSKGVETVFAAFGPRPSSEQVREAESIGSFVWLDAPLDWLVEDEEALKQVPRLLNDLIERENIDLVHLNLPSQAVGLETSVPVVVVSHSCVVTWFAAVRGQTVPNEWQWQFRLNYKGFDRANAVLSPSHSHAAMLRRAYGPIDGLQVVYNASRVEARSRDKEDFVFAAARWWDDGKNGVILDAAAGQIKWPLVMAGACHGPNGQYLPIRNAVDRGELAHTDAMAMMARAAIVASPSVYEPFGLVALEAARSGSALVLADIPTYRELWDGAALFADPREPRAFADAINRLSRDVSQRTTLAEEALVRSEKYSLEAQADAVMALYLRLLSASRPALTAAE